MKENQILENIIKLETLYGFSLSIEQKPKESFIIINPVRKNYNKKAMENLLESFGNIAGYSIITSKEIGEAYVLYKND